MQRFSFRFGQFPLQREQLFGFLILSALFFFEIFNYSTTEFALHDLLGEMRFAGMSWATILAVAFCGIDFAGIARLFTPEDATSPAVEVWYLLGAWLLAATMNALLTWWGVSIALLQHTSQGSAVIDQHTLLSVVPVFVALLVWLVRVLIIGTISTAGPRLFAPGRQPARHTRPVPARGVAARPAMAAARRVATTRRSAPPPPPEPTYEPLYSAAAQPQEPRQV